MAGVPEGCLKIASVRVTLYLTTEGEQKFYVENDGDVAFSTLFGMLKIAEHSLLADFDDQGDDE